MSLSVATGELKGERPWMSALFFFGCRIYNSSRIGGLVRASNEGEYFARPIVFMKNEVAFANPISNRPWIVEAWARCLGAGVRDVHGNDR